MVESKQEDEVFNSRIELVANEIDSIGETVWFKNENENLEFWMESKSQQITDEKKEEIAELGETEILGLRNLFSDENFIRVLEFHGKVRSG
jgi:hypothetical protein